jgi:hypothetical protein
MKKPTRSATIAMLAAIAFAAGAAAEEKFQKVSGGQIRAKIAGVEVSDEVHWRDFNERSGKLTSSSWR